MAKKKKSKKRSSVSFLKNRKFLFLVAIILAVVVIAGISSFAGGAKTKGRVYSWKTGKVVDYQVKNQAPDGSTPTAPVQEEPEGNGENNSTNNTEGDAPEGNENSTLSGLSSLNRTATNQAITTAETTSGTYQYINYSPAEWGDAYLGIYTEASTPAYATRDLKLGDSGEDVQILRSALKTIGKFPVYRGTTDDTKIPYTKYKDTLNNVHPILKNLDTTSQSFDSNLSQAIDAISYPNLDSSYGTYLKDSMLNRYEQVRILAMTTSAWGAPTAGKYLAFTGVKGSTSEYPVVTKASMPGYNAHVTDFNGQKDLRKTNEPVYKAYPRLTYMTPKTTPDFDSRALKSGHKGGDVKTLEQMLYMVTKFGPSRGFTTTGFKVDEIYDFATQELLKQLELYYANPNTDGVFGRRINHLLINELMWPIYR